MRKSKYSEWTKEELIKRIEALEKRKKYGLVWDEEKTKEKFEAEAEGKFPVLKEVKSKEIKTDPEKPTHILIEGDNYHALSVLNYTHERKIDVIYIDPPYNTGAKDWKYNNDYVDANDGYRHSKWIDMMNKRLRLARNLLKSNGILICAIDDNELAHLLLLLEEIFPSKVLNTVVIMNNPHGVARAGFSRSHEYAIFVLNQGQTVNKKKVPEDTRNINLRRSGNNALRADSPTMFYPIYVDKKTLEIIGVGDVPSNDFHPKQQTYDKKEYYEVWPIDEKNIEKNWYYSRKRVEEYGKNELKCKLVKGQIRITFYHSNNSEQTYKSVWIDSEYDAGAYGATLVKTLTNNNFPFPKSVNTVLDCLKAVIKNENSIILDFFAGSGTTGHAVSLLNKEGNRHQFILCTNNENNIARDICYPRLKSVINGHKDYKEITGIKSNLKYYKTAFVPQEPTDKNRELLTKETEEMLCLRENTFELVLEKTEYKIYKNSKKYLGIVWDQLAIDAFKKEVSKYDKNISVYVFSLTDEDFSSEFADMKKKIKVCSIPEAILRVYRRIFTE